MRRPLSDKPTAAPSLLAPFTKTTLPESVDAARREPLTVLGVPLGSGWQLAPLRLFLGVTFIYAGMQKLTDPQFFNPKAALYIGRQLLAFAHSSPIRGLLLHVALPHATFFGGLIAWSEIAIGLATLVGLLARPAVVGGLLLSLLFFLSVTWRVYPYFYGADVVFCFGWLALGLAPHAGLPNLDERAADWLAPRVRLSPRARQILLVAAFSLVGAAHDEATAASSAPAARRADARRPGRRSGRAGAQRQESRRDFLMGLGSGALAALGLAWLWSLLHPAAPAGATPSTSGSTSGTPGATSTGSSVIAHTTDLPQNAAATFTIPTSGDPGVVVHLADGRYVAYDATCTHAGCPVQYDAQSKELLCPCHGAVFDPANQAAVLQGPTNLPLTPVQITVQSNGDIVLA